MIRILTVDDWDHRHHGIRTSIEGAGFTGEWRRRHTPADVTDADLEWCQLACLDHDMCRRGFNDETGIWAPDDNAPCPSPVTRGDNHLDKHCGCPTGTDLVRRMVALPHRPGVVVHSANPIAAPGMARTLADAGFRVALFPATQWARGDWRRAVRAAVGVA